MSEILTYRQGTIDDLSALLELGIAAYSPYRDVLEPQHWQTLERGLHDEAELKALIERSIVFICHHAAGTPAGAAYFVPQGNPTPVFDRAWCCIRRLGVHPDFRGQGIARTLTQMCIDQAIRSGEHTMALHTSEFMDTARNMYERMGFRQQYPIPDLFGKKYWLYTLSLKDH